MSAVWTELPTSQDCRQEKILKLFCRVLKYSEDDWRQSWLVAKAVLSLLVMFCLCWWCDLGINHKNPHISYRHWVLWCCNEQLMWNADAVSTEAQTQSGGKKKQKKKRLLFSTNLPRGNWQHWSILWHGLDVVMYLWPAAGPAYLNIVYFMLPVIHSEPEIHMCHFIINYNCHISWLIFMIFVA